MKLLGGLVSREKFIEPGVGASYADVPMPHEFVGAAPNASRSGHAVYTHSTSWTLYQQGLMDIHYSYLYVWALGWTTGTASVTAVG